MYRLGSSVLFRSAFAAMKWVRDWIGFDAFETFCHMPLIYISFYSRNACAHKVKTRVKSDKDKRQASNNVNDPNRWWWRRWKWKWAQQSRVDREKGKKCFRREFWIPIRIYLNESVLLFSIFCCCLSIWRWLLFIFVSESLLLLSLVSFFSRSPPSSMTTLPCSGVWTQKPCYFHILTQLRHTSNFFTISLTHASNPCPWPWHIS